jgi:HAD superfamily hydrolase (TIGR01509 family)
MIPALVRSAAVKKSKQLLSCDGLKQPLWEVQKKLEHVDCFSMHKPITVTLFEPATHIIFNMDGVVLDTEGIHEYAHSMYLAKYKKKYTSELRKTVMGMSLEDQGKQILNNYDIPLMTPEIYAHGIWQYMRDLCPKCRIIKGADDFICHLKSHKVPIALATSSNARAFHFKSKQYKKLMNAFCHIVLGDDHDITRGKPSPDLYLLAAERFPNAPRDMSKVLVIEDSPAGVRAAKAAGMQCVMLADNIFKKGEVKEADDMVRLLENISLKDFTLPPFIPVR